MMEDYIASYHQYVRYYTKNPWSWKVDYTKIHDLGSLIILKTHDLGSPINIITWSVTAGLHEVEKGIKSHGRPTKGILLVESHCYGWFPLYKVIQILPICYLCLYGWWGNNGISLMEKALIFVLWDKFSFAMELFDRNWQWQPHTQKWLNSCMDQHQIKFRMIPHDTW